MDFLDKMKLPQSSKQEELEQLSKDKLRPLFNHEYFEIREEIYRDKGIDLSIELKYNEKYTNFRFLVQLKSTETKKQNKDGSYSWQIDTSNIQYLLNGGKPAYYICYVKETDTFYYQLLNDFITDISSKNKDWNVQNTHTLRVSKVLNSSSISEIYNKVKTRCQLSRELTEKIDIKVRNDAPSKISISEEYKITDETSIVKFVEEIGFNLISKGHSKEIVLLNEKVSNDIKSPLYNLILGVSNYYTANLFNSLSFFQTAKRKQKLLNKSQAENLEYFDTIVKFSLGLIDEVKYQEILDSLKSSEHLRDYIKLENIEKKYFNSSFSDDDFQVFKNEVFEIINDEKVDSNIKFIAKCKYILYWGKKTNMMLLRFKIKLNMPHNEFNDLQKLGIQISQLFKSERQEWISYCEKTFEEILAKEDFFAYNLTVLNQAKVSFELFVLSHIIQKHYNQEDFDSSAENSLDNILHNLKVISENYKRIQLIENLLASLSVQYEIYHYLNKNDNANQIMEEMLDLIDFHGLNEFKPKIDFLLKQGTTGELLFNLFQNTIQKSEDENKEYQNIVEEMKNYDILEKALYQKNKTESVTVELFPIGHFSIERVKLRKFYEILNIDSYKLTTCLDAFFDNNIIPVLNIFNEIKVEGYCNGMLDYKGIENWRKIKEIRSQMFENKFYRQEIKF